MYTEEKLEECLKTAYSYESRKGHKKEEFKTTMIGSVRKRNRIYDLYVDEAKNYWYKSRVITEKGIVSEYEAIFGHPERRSANGFQNYNGDRGSGSHGNFDYGRNYLQGRRRVV